MSTTDPTQWHKSTRSNGQGGDCVEHRFIHGEHQVRDSKNPDGPRLAFGPAAWAAFVAAVKADQLDQR